MTRKENSVVNKLESSIKVYDFMRWSFIAFSSSVILFLASIIVIFMQGFNWGLDFTGGTIVELHLEQTIDIDQIRKAIEQSGFKEAIV
ncbi:MAG: protein translocase subunit SecF, partial [Candidatus Baumannia cicadellinicola]|nr:protein translocase subunit SecF [Candidatus Baumannia cicadellinicola]